MKQYQVNRRHGRIEEVLRLTVTACDSEEASDILKSIGYEVIAINKTLNIITVQ